MCRLVIIECGLRMKDEERIGIEKSVRELSVCLLLLLLLLLIIIIIIIIIIISHRSPAAVSLGHLLYQAPRSHSKDTPHSVGLL